MEENDPIRFDHHFNGKDRSRIDYRSHGRDLSEVSKPGRGQATNRASWHSKGKGRIELKIVAMEGKEPERNFGAREMSVLELRFSLRIRKNPSIISWPGKRENVSWISLRGNRLIGSELCGEGSNTNCKAKRHLAMEKRTKALSSDGSNGTESIYWHWRDLSMEGRRKRSIWSEVCCKGDEQITLLRSRIDKWFRHPLWLMKFIKIRRCIQ